MKTMLLLPLASCLLVGMSYAQLADTVPDRAAVLTDQGTWMQPGPGNHAQPDLPGSLSTQFAANNSFRGNMFDIAPAVSLSIHGIDLNASAPAGQAVTLDVWYRVGTSFGFEDSAAGWSRLASGSGVAQGPDKPTFVDLSGNGVRFQGGRTYGLYVDLTSYTPTRDLRYTNGGPTVWANSELTLTTNVGKADPPFTGATFAFREWNGRLYYNVEPGKRVAIAAAAETNLANCRYTDVQSKLLATGKFETVDILDVISTTPALSTLRQYDAVITWSNVAYFDSVALGNTLADYVDAGGGVVVATFANASTSATGRLQGRWLTGGYEVIIGGSGLTGGAATLGAILAPNHPIMDGVASFAGNTSFRPAVTALNTGSTPIALWSDGRVLVAAGALAGRADLGFFPPSSDCTSNFWDSSTDGALLMANALCHVAAPKLAVALVAAAAQSSADCRFTDVQSKLLATGKFKTVDIINTNSTIPTLRELLRYDSVLCWTDLASVDSVAWGNVMADYVDAGGGVVVATRANSSSAPGERLAGRWLTGNYEVIVSASGTTTGAATLGAVLEPGHPILAGVTTFLGGGSSFRPTGTALTPGSRTIARWSDGKVLVAVGGNRNRADLGFFPTSSDCVATSWVSSSDGALLMANALCHVARPQLAVALVAAASFASDDCRFLDVRSKLLAAGGFSRVDIVNASPAGALPILEDLKRYDALMVWSNNAWIDADAMGNVLADYVDAGGGVVSTVFANGSIPLGGRWASDGYEVILPGGDTLGGNLSLGAVLVPGHPLMHGVTSFAGGSLSLRSTSVTLTPGSTEIARWSNGGFLVVAGRHPRRVDLNMHPPSSDCSGGFWTASTDGGRMLANSLRYVGAAASSGATTTAYCIAKEGLFCGLPSIGAVGVPSASATSGFTISAGPARANRFGVLLYTNAGRGAVPFPAGGHILCIAFPPLRRGGPVDSGGSGSCDGVFSLDMNEFASGNYLPGFPTNSPASFLLSIGTEVNCQWWGRDTVATGSFMSNALEYCVGP